jgi:hypothetical protein
MMNELGQMFRRLTNSVSCVCHYRDWMLTMSTHRKNGRRIWLKAGFSRFARSSSGERKNKRDRGITHFVQQIGNYRGGWWNSCAIPRCFGWETRSCSRLQHSKLHRASHNSNDNNLVCFLIVRSADGKQTKHRLCTRTIWFTIERSTAKTFNG